MEHQKHIHIVYIITKLELGGAQKVCLALADYFAQHKHFSITFITGAGGLLTQEVYSIEHLNKALILLADLTREYSSTIGECKSFIKLFLQLRTLKKKYKDILVHTHSTKAGVLGRWAAWLARIPHRIHTIHGYAFHDFQPFLVRFFLISIEYLTSRITTHFICVSEQDHTTGCRYFPKFKEKSSLIRAAVDNSFFVAASSCATQKVMIKKRPHDYTQEQYIIGTVSCFKPQKNLIDLLKAFYQLYEQAPTSLKKGLMLHIIGDGSQRDQLESWVTVHQLSAHVLFLGWQNNVSTWMSKWKLFALSSLWEGLPCSVVEARLHKLPVIAYDSGGVREVIKHHENGALIPAGNWQQLAQELHYLVYNHDAYQRMSAYNDNFDDFTYTTMRERHADLYRSLLNRQEEQSCKQNKTTQRKTL